MYVCVCVYVCICMCIIVYVRMCVCVWVCFVYVVIALCCMFSLVGSCDDSFLAMDVLVGAYRGFYTSEDCRSVCTLALYGALNRIYLSLLLDV